ncbi:MAG TPA: polysaccharide biosynthesis tyrosine autokinase [Polyangiaceae bacterium]|nr:polysaccharide biosynthesis tyrosine autokinase [Polyangiaceae bacterium]
MTSPHMQPATPVSHPDLEPRPPARQPESSLTPAAIWAALRRNWIIIAVATVLAGLGATFFTMGQKPIYEAQATMLFDPQPPRPLGKEVQAVVDMSGDYLNKREYYRTQYWVIQSQRIATMVVQQLALHQDGRFIENTPPGKAAVVKNIKVEDAATILRGRIAVEPIKESQLAKVTYQDADPARAQRILATIVDVYAQNNLDDALDAMGVAGDWLTHQVDSLRNDVETSELALHGYKKDKNILSVSMDDQSNMLRNEIQQLNAALTTTRTQREQIAARRSELLEINPEEPWNVPATELLNSGLLQKLRTDYVMAVTTRNELLAGGKGTSHPSMLGVQSRVDSTREALLAEVKNVQGAVDHDFNVSTAAMNRLNGLLEDAKRRALDLNLLEIEFNRLRRTRDNSEKLYGLVTERAKENDLTKLLRFNNIRVVDRPMLPRRPVTPNLPLNIASGLMAGLLLGVVLGIGREQLDATIKTPDDAERILGLNFLGLLPLMEGDGAAPGNNYYRSHRRQKTPEAAPLTMAELVVHEQPTSGVAEAARAVRTNIMFMSPDRPHRVLLITSAAPAEGKTTVACSIAIAMAQAGRRVLLVDCDMRRPRIHRIFRHGNDVGITTALLDLNTLSQSIRETDIPNLSVITTGPLPPNPAELLHSETFEKLLAKLRDQFDNIVIDSPPVAPVTDAAILSTKVDGTVLVTRSFKSRRDVALRAARTLQDVSGRLAGTVLNAVNFERRKYGYYQYYYRQAYGSDITELASRPAVKDEERPPA